MDLKTPEGRQAMREKLTADNAAMKADMAERRRRREEMHDPTLWDLSPEQKAYFANLEEAKAARMEEAKMEVRNAHLDLGGDFPEYQPSEEAKRREASVPKSFMDGFVTGREVFNLSRQAGAMIGQLRSRVRALSKELFDVAGDIGEITGRSDKRINELEARVAALEGKPAPQRIVTVNDPLPKPRMRVRAGGYRA